MNTYFYTDANGQKQGPVSKRKLQILAAQGVIDPNTPVETFDGRIKLAAGQLPSLWDRSLPNESSGAPYWGTTVVLTLLTCVLVLPGALLFPPIVFLAAMIPFLLLMRMLFYIESHLRSIREHYENSE